MTEQLMSANQLRMRVEKLATMASEHLMVSVSTSTVLADTGAVILTGEAIKKRNAKAIAEIFAADSGKFVCASAGHHLGPEHAGAGHTELGRDREHGRERLDRDRGVHGSGD